MAISPFSTFPVATRSLVLVMAGLPVFAGDWSIAPTTCVPKDGDIAKYNVVGNTVQFRDTVTGTFELVCHMSNPNDNGEPGWRWLDVVYNDPDGASNGSQVKVTLYVVHHVLHFGVHSVPEASLDSNLFPAGQRFRSVSSTYPIRPISYYVLITISRSKTSLNPRISNIRLR
jgi:hypothetical protein